MDDHTQAISFANSYFALVDGLACGLESHFAEDVLLDWFGRMIRGRKNVATFMNARRKNSRHIFPDILASSGISYDQHPVEREESFSCESKNDAKGEFGGSEITVNGDDPIYGLTEGDLSNLFKLDIMPTDVEEIERSINRIKLEEEMAAPTMKAINRECTQEDGHGAIETSTIKYVEANGQIEFSPKVCNSGGWEMYSYGMRSGHCRRRLVRLQIAYSMVSSKPTTQPLRKDKKPVSRFGHPKSRLPSLEELGELSSRLVPKSEGLDFFTERNSILRSLESELAREDPQSLLLSPQYEEGKLVIKKPSAFTVNCDSQNHKNFIFNYKIHVIVYQAKSRCRVNLLQEFEESKSEEGHLCA